jgi:2-dehydropantoate 2-reductase
VLAGTLTAAVDMTAPGDVTRRGRGGIALARVDGSTVPARIAALFQTAGFQTVTVDDWRALRWSKLLLNMVTAATSAILDMSTADIVSHARLFRIEQLAFREAGRVMVANGVQTISLPAYPVPLMRLAMRLPCPLAQRVLAPRIGGARRGGSPGTRGEIARGRSEIPYRNGAVANEALRLGLHAPVNAALTGIVGEILEHPERRDDFRGHPETLIRSLRERGVMA